MTTETYSERWLRELRERPAKERAARRAAAEEGRDFDTDSDDSVICPWCAAEFEPDNPADWDHGRSETCDECEKKFSVVVEYSVSYETTKVEDE